MNTMFGWVMHYSGKGFQPDICSLDGKVVLSLPRQQRLERARRVLEDWAENHPEAKLIMMPGDDGLSGNPVWKNY